MNNSSGLVIALFAFFGLAAIVALVATARRGETNNLPSIPTGIVAGQPLHAEAKVIYENTERISITWNADGLPIEIVTKRHVEQLPW